MIDQQTLDIKALPILQVLCLNLFCVDKMEKKNQTKYHTVGTIPKSNIKIVEGGKIDTSNTQI
jgi:hypothetical protein